MLATGWGREVHLTTNVGVPVESGAACCAATTILLLARVLCP